MLDNNTHVTAILKSQQVSVTMYWSSSQLGPAGFKNIICIHFVLVEASEA